MATSFEHLKGLAASDFPPPRTPGACEECLVEKTPWVALRECWTCGHVGCCDSSLRRHATRHFRETQHPVMRSVMPGDSWDWCYVHEASDDLGASYSPR
jgi:uncharacterized UBP type Zn finger protein